MANAQPPSRHLIVLGGFSIPVGSFSKTSGTDAAYAESGIALGVEFTSALAKNLQIGLSGTILLHKYDSESKHRSMKDTLPKFVVHADDYICTSLMGMVGYNTDISSAIVLYARGEAGAFIFRQPEIREDNITHSGSGRRTKSSAVVISPGYGVDLGVVISEKFVVGVRYFYSQPNYTVSVHEAHGTTQTAAYTMSLKQPVSTIQIVVGYVFGL